MGGPDHWLVLSSIETPLQEFEAMQVAVHFAPLHAQTTEGMDGRSMGFHRCDDSKFRQAP